MASHIMAEDGVGGGEGVGAVETARGQAGLPINGQGSCANPPTLEGGARFRCKDYGKREYNFLIK